MGSFFLLRKHRSTLFYSPRLYSSGSRVSHIKGGGGWREEMKEKNTVCSMCEVHASDTACMCVKLWAHVMSWNRSVHTGLWDHMKLWVLLTRESCLGGIQCCMSISQTEWPLSSQKTIVSLRPYRLAPEGKTEQTWACTFKDRRWSNSPLISQGSWDCYILLGWLLKSQKLNARDWLSPTDVTVKKKGEKKSSCQFSEEGSYWNVTGSSAFWCRVAGWSKDSWLYSFHLSLASQARGDSWTWGRLSECACRVFHMRRWGRVGTEKMDKQDKEWEILNEWLLNAESPSMEKKKNRPSQTNKVMRQK